MSAVSRNDKLDAILFHRIFNRSGTPQSRIKSRNWKILRKGSSVWALGGNGSVLCNRLVPSRLSQAELTFFIVAHGSGGPGGVSSELVKGELVLAQLQLLLFVTEIVKFQGHISEAPIWLQLV